MLPKELEKISLDISAGKLWLNCTEVTGDISEMHLDFVDGHWSFSLTASKNYSAKGKALPDRTELK